MEFGEYQFKSYTAIQDHADSKEEEMHWALGLGEESGEVLGVIKHRHYGQEFSVADLVEELGDALWHIASICTVFGISMDGIAEYNLAKLAYRYPDGTFDEERCNNRHAIGAEFKNTAEAKAIIDKFVGRIGK